MPANRDPDAVLASLMAGNERYAAGKTQQQSRTPADFATDATGQAPLAAIVGCADSRVPPEIVFDQGVGDLFVCRAAGNLVSGTGAIIKGSLEFAVAELGVQLIMVLGHSECGAVKAAIAHVDAKDALPGAIGPLIELIKPAVLATQGRPGDKLNNVIRANVARCVARVKGTEPILSRAVDAGKLKVVGAVYELSTGKVEIVA
jgi:carbonic anhydrase